MPDLISSREWTLALPDLTLLDYLVWNIFQELFCEEKRELFVNFKDLQNVIRDKWPDVVIRQSESEKPCCSEKSVYQQWQSRMKDLFSTFFAEQLIDDLVYCDVLL